MSFHDYLLLSEVFEGMEIINDLVLSLWLWKQSISVSMLTTQKWCCPMGGCVTGRVRTFWLLAQHTVSYVQYPKSSMGASFFEMNREEKNKILMFSQQCLTQILEEIQENLNQYFYFLHLSHFPDVASLWQNLGDPEEALSYAHPCKSVVLIQHLGNIWGMLHPFSRQCTLLWCVCAHRWRLWECGLFLMHQNAIGLWTTDFLSGFK